MKHSINKTVLEALKDQSEIFGDFLYEQVDLGLLNRLNKEDRIEKKIVVAKKIEKEETSNLFLEEFQKANNLSELNALICNCLKCPLGKTRTKFVFGVGNPNADAMLIGEAPGADEDKQGEPFVGRAGKLLNDILAAIKFKREEVYIANILKCRPPGNRDPELLNRH